MQDLQTGEMVPIKGGLLKVLFSKCTRMGNNYMIVLVNTAAKEAGEDGK